MKMRIFSFFMNCVHQIKFEGLTELPCHYHCGRDLVLNCHILLHLKYIILYYFDLNLSHTIHRPLEKRDIGRMYYSCWIVVLFSRKCLKGLCDETALLEAPSQWHRIGGLFSRPSLAHSIDLCYYLPTRETSVSIILCYFSDTLR